MIVDFQHAHRGVTPAERARRAHHGRRALRTAATAVALLLGAAGCTKVTASAVKADRDAGVTRDYARPPGELYQAAVLGLESLRSDPNWRDLEITERDPAQGVVIAERDLDSAVIPGLGERDAIGVFVAEAPGGDSAVTVVRMSSDQFPGSAGTTINTARDASGLIFPAIDQALATIPEAPRTRVAAATPPPATSATGAAAAATTGRALAAPAAPSAAASAPARVASAPAHGETTIDRLYATLRDGGTWRPLVRELATDGREEIRIGSWAVLGTTGDRVVLRVKNKSGSAVDAARLALDLERAGFAVDVEGTSER